MTFFEVIGTVAAVIVFVGGTYVSGYCLGRYDERCIWRAKK